MMLAKMKQAYVLLFSLVRAARTFFGTLNGFIRQERWREEEVFCLIKWSAFLSL